MRDVPDGAERRIAKIDETMLGWEDHGIFTCVVGLDYGGSHQGAGMYMLDTFDKKADRRVGTAEGTEFLMRFLRACGVDRWERLKGRTVYAVATHTKVLAIEPLPTEPGVEFWFDDLWEEK
jgi:hypothetical protein